MKVCRAMIAALACACTMLGVAQAAVTGTLSGSQLRVSLSAATDKARVKPDGSGNILVVDDNSTTTVFTTPASGVQSLLVQGTSSALQQATLDGTFSMPSGVTVNTIGTLIHIGQYDMGASGAYSATVTKNIFVGADGTGTVFPATLTSGTGAISLTANSSGTTAGVFLGIEVQAATVTSGSGNITLRGRGGNVAGGNHGIEVDATATVSSSTGTILLVGTGGAAAGDGNVGVRVQGDGTLVKGGGIDLSGTGGGTGTSSNNYGIEFVGGAQVSSPAMFLSVNGTGGPSTGTGNSGVVVHGSGAITGPTAAKCAGASNYLCGFIGTPGGGTSSYGMDVGNGGGILSATGGGYLSLQADSLNIDTTSAVLSSTGSLGVAINVKTATTSVVIGAADSPGVLGLTPAELSRVSGSNTLTVTGGTGGLTVSVPLTLSLTVLNLGATGPINGPGPVQASNVDITDKSSTPHSWVVNGTSVTEDGNVPVQIGGAGGQVYVIGGSGSDTFTVTPTNLHQIGVIGGNPAPPAVPGDTLILTQAGTSLTWSSSATGYSGSVAFSGLGSVFFQQIESGHVAPYAFVVTPPANVIAGVPFSMNVTAVDAVGNLVDTYTGVVHVTSSDGAAALPADATLVNGTGTFVTTLTTEGVQTLSATDTVKTTLTGTSSSVNVLPAPASHFTVTAPAGVAEGSPLTFTVTALDPFNNVVTSYPGTIHFASSDGGATLPVDSPITGGTGSFGATLRTQGGQVISAFDSGDPSVTGASNVIGVTAGAATHLLVSAPASAIAGVATTVTVSALDVLNNIANSYTGTVHFTSVDAAAVLPANATLTNGTGTFSVTFKTSGSQSVAAIDTVTAPLNATSNTVNVSAGPATHLLLATAATASAGTASSVSVTAQDAFNNTAASYAGIVHFTSTDGAAVLPANATLASGIGTFGLTFKTAGSQTATGTDTVTSSITGTSSTVTVTASAAAQLAISAPTAVAGGSGFLFTVAALDASGNPVTSYSGTVHFTSSDANATLPADVTLSGGTGSFNATLRVAGHQSITATDTASSTVTGTSSAIAVSMNTYSAPSATGTGTITASFTGGGVGCSFASPQFIAAPPGSSPVPPTLPAPSTLFPQGMFDFSLMGCDVGSTVTFTITYPSSIDGARYWKYGPESANHTPHWYVMPATISGNAVTFSITDGGQGDDNLAADGTIDDQGGPGISTSGVPTLSEWMLGTLALMLLAIGASARRRS
jgi:hypothetical protein